MSVKICVASSEDERASVFRFRYDVFVQELNLFQESADHDEGSFSDPHDRTAHLIYAKDEGGIIGTVRINWGGDAPFSREFRETYHLNRFEVIAPPESVMVVTRLAVEKGSRGGRLALLLVRFCATFAKEHNAYLSFCDCQPHLLRLYESLGFRPYARPYNDPSYGIMVPLLSIGSDSEHMAEIQSPLAKTLSGWEPPANLEEIRSLIPVVPSVREVQELETGGTRDRIRSLAESSGDATFGLFDGLSEADMDELLARSHVISCNRGDYVIREGTVTNTVFSVIEGELEVRVDNEIVCIMAAGECFGELSLLHSIPRTADVIVYSEQAVVLSLSETNLNRLISGKSNLASKFLMNLARSLAMKLLRKGLHSQKI
jgi:predicted GNAT family N-acyltransferase